MKNKNNLFMISFLTLLLGVSLVIRFQEEKIETTLHNVNSKLNNQDNFERSLPRLLEIKDEFLSTSITSHELWPHFRNYAHSNDFIFSHSEETIELIQKILNEVPNCLRVNLCNQNRKNNERYFDIEHTPAHNLLERALSLLINMKEENVSDFEKIAKDDLIKLMDIRNETIQGLALELVLTKNLSINDENYLLKKLPTLHQDTSAAAYGMLFEKFKDDPLIRTQLISSLKNDLKSNDQDKAIKIVKTLKNLELNKREIDEIIKNNCKNKSGDHNKKAIETYLMQSTNEKIRCS